MQNQNIKKTLPVIIIILTIVCIYSMRVNSIQEREITEIRNQVLKDRQMLGRSTSFIGKANHSYFFKVKIERDNGTVFDVPLFQTRTGGSTDDGNVVMFLFELQTPGDMRSYRIRQEEEDGGGWSIHNNWGTLDHLKEYDFDKEDISMIIDSLFAGYGDGEIKNGQSLRSFTRYKNKTTTKGTLMVEVREGSISDAEKGPGF